MEFSEEETQVEVVPPGGQMSLDILTFEKNRIRENIVKTKLVCKGQLFHLSICSIQRPLVDPLRGRQSLQIREPHVVLLQNLKSNSSSFPNNVGS